MVYSPTAQSPQPAPKKSGSPFRDDRRERQTPSETPPTATGALFLGPPRHATLPCMIERE